MKTKLTVRNCPPPFQFICSKLWDDLAATDRPEVRHCDRCARDVHFCRTDEETIAHANAGHCIAREVPDGARLPIVTVGRTTRESVELTPDEEQTLRWLAREDQVDDAIRNAPRSTRSCPSCGYPAPDWRVRCRVCGTTIGRVS